MKILVTGGTGFIGSHTCVELIAAGNEVVIIDRLMLLIRLRILQESVLRFMRQIAVMRQHWRKYSVSIKLMQLFILPGIKR